MDGGKTQSETFVRPVRTGIAGSMRGERGSGADHNITDGETSGGRGGGGAGELPAAAARPSVRYATQWAQRLRCGKMDGAGSVRISWGGA